MSVVKHEFVLSHPFCKEREKDAAPAFDCLQQLRYMKDNDK
jgi:hypothetical protein